MSDPRRRPLPHQHLANDLADAGFVATIQIGDTVTGHAVPVTPTPDRAIAQHLHTAAKNLAPGQRGYIVMDLDGNTDGVLHPLTDTPKPPAGFYAWGVTHDLCVTPPAVEATRRSLMGIADTPANALVLVPTPFPAADYARWA